MSTEMFEGLDRCRNVRDREDLEMRPGMRSSNCELRRWHEEDLSPGISDGHGFLRDTTDVSDAAVN